MSSIGDSAGRKMPRADFGLPIRRRVRPSGSAAEFRRLLPSDFALETIAPGSRLACDTTSDVALAVDPCPTLAVCRPRRPPARHGPRDGIVMIL